MGGERGGGEGGEGEPLSPAILGNASKIVSGGAPLLPNRFGYKPSLQVALGILAMKNYKKAIVNLMNLRMISS